MIQEAIKVLPLEFQQDWQAAVESAEPTPGGVFRLVGIEKTDGAGYQAQRIVTLVLDENGFPLPNVKVAFAYSTAPPYFLTDNYQWSPPAPRKAHIVRTQGGGQADEVQGSPVKRGQPGGMTVYILEPEFSSDVITGCGMLHDHTGMHLTFQLQRPDVEPYDERLAAIEERLAILEGVSGEQS